MTTLKHFPLGAACPDSPHAVASSLPTMADVRGYEEKDPRVLEKLRCGYPRFVVHPFVAELIGYYLEREAPGGRAGVLVAGDRAARDLVRHAGGSVRMESVDAGVALVHFDPDDDTATKVRKYVQHTGCGVSSRQAEDLLLAYGRRSERFAEAAYAGNAAARVESELAGLCGCRGSDVLICSSGMSAFFAGFSAIREFQRRRGRTRWLQLGWLYLDSGCILKEFLGDSERLDHHYDVSDTDALIDAIEEAGETLAAVVVECPTNPLARVCDLKRVAAAVRAAGGVMLVDPTLASIYNVDVLPYADILVTSLTKYAAHEGDVLAGALALNPESPYYGDLVLEASRHHVPPYARDLARLAWEMEGAPAAVAAMNANAARLAKFLEAHPGVRRAYHAAEGETFGLVGRGPSTGGAIITIELRGSLEGFYDRVDVMKGPSFGTDFTLLCPFLYLAHYELVTSPEGRALLEGAGLDPELVRISVGVEDYDMLEATFARALSLEAADSVSK
ncbi:MAG: PLP-dependent transferase [Verrucomicrobiota bacterium]